mmetsp:Transcript_7230/g.17879  ORF Transcript_7230/g.17879 Transcript_7230/m.17879 type:complete len:220 (-) Transcript_7230:1227-1886(-)
MPSTLHPRSTLALSPMSDQLTRKPSSSPSSSSDAPCTSGSCRTSRCTCACSSRARAACCSAALNSSSLAPRSRTAAASSCSLRSNAALMLLMRDWLDTWLPPMEVVMVAWLALGGWLGRPGCAEPTAAAAPPSTAGRAANRRAAAAGSPCRWLDSTHQSLAMAAAAACGGCAAEPALASTTGAHAFSGPPCRLPPAPCQPLGMCASRMCTGCAPDSSCA